MLQCSFICGLLGGPEIYQGESMAKGHAMLPITDDVFNKLAFLLVICRELDRADFFFPLELQQQQILLIII